MTDSQQLLAEFVLTGSEAAFRELLDRYLNLVYSTALRLVHGDTQLAEDVAQTVFIDLALTAPSLPKGVMVGGWLHRHTCYVGSKTMRGEYRRQLREQQAVEMNSIQNDLSDCQWAQVAPMLDEAINELAAEDRAAILLRFFEQLDFRSVGQALGRSEEAARKRVDRALEKLHVLLKHRGVTLSGAALGMALTTEAVTAAPAGLATSIVGPALAGAVTGKASLTLLKIVTMTKLKLGLIGALVVAGVATPLVIQHQAQAHLRQEEQLLARQRVQLQELTAENELLSNRLAIANDSSSLSQTQLSDLLRLRNEVGQLKRSRASEQADPAVAAAKSWATQVSKLKARLQQMPDKQIPELQWLTEADWLEAAKNSELNSDQDYRKAFAKLRNRAKESFGAMLQGAMQKYMAANNGLLPEDLVQLKPYFDSPIDENVLRRYATFSYSAKASDLPREAILAMEVAAPADDEYDTLYQYRLNGKRFGSVNPDISALLSATLDFARANNGQIPSDHTQLLAYLKHPVDQQLAQTFLKLMPANALLHLQ